MKPGFQLTNTFHGPAQSYLLETCIKITHHSLFISYFVMIILCIITAVSVLFQLHDYCVDVQQNKTGVDVVPVVGL